MRKQYELDELTPSMTVKELDRYIIGQDEAKKAVAVALRNRYRRSQLTDEEREEITPKNIILMGPTGVGKTEITRRISKLVNAPLIKVEATKFTEVGYVGRDVESMVRDLVNRAVRDAEQIKIEEVRARAEANAEEKLVDILSGIRKREKRAGNSLGSIFGNKRNSETPEQIAERNKRVEEKKAKREIIRQDLKDGKLEDNIITIEVVDKPSTVFGMVGGMEDMSINDMFGGILPEKTKKRKLKVKEARNVLIEQEAEKLIDQDEVREMGIRNAEQNGIIFIDEIDKIIGSDTSGGRGPDVSREGVQRDILPIVEGSTVNTKYGPVKTDFILFIGSGAFHGTKVSDMIPELQGRFPINVRLESLTEENFVEILKNTENSILKQYNQLLGTEGIDLEFTDDAVDTIASIAYEENMNNEDIGARRLQTVLEKLLEDISFQAPDIEDKHIVIDKDFVTKTLSDEIKAQDYKKYLI